MSQDTRKDKRAKVVSLNVRYKSATVDEFIENHSHDVSKGGLFVKTPTPFPPGTLLKFEIRLAGDKSVISGVGRVVWKREPTSAGADKPAGMGVKFIKIDDSSRAIIDRLITQKADAGSAYTAEQPMDEAPVGHPSTLRGLVAATPIGEEPAPAPAPPPKASPVNVPPPAGPAAKLPVPPPAAAPPPPVAKSAFAGGTLAGPRPTGLPGIAAPAAPPPAAAAPVVPPPAPSSKPGLGKGPPRPGGGPPPPAAKLAQTAIGVAPAPIPAAVPPPEKPISEPKLPPPTPPPPGAPPPRPAPPARKATMMGIGIPSTPPGSGEKSDTGSLLPSPTPPPAAAANANIASATPPPPKAAEPMFPKLDPESGSEPAREQTVMKQAAELLEEALKEAGGSLEEIGQNPLFANQGADPLEGIPESARVQSGNTLVMQSPLPGEQPSPIGPTPGMTAERSAPLSAAASPSPSAPLSASIAAKAADAPRRLGDDLEGKKKGGSGGLIVALLLLVLLVGGGVYAWKTGMLAGIVGPPATPPSGTASTPTTPPSSIPSASSMLPVAVMDASVESTDASAMGTVVDASAAKDAAPESAADAGKDAGKEKDAGGKPATTAAAPRPPRPPRPPTAPAGTPDQGESEAPAPATTPTKDPTPAPTPTTTTTSAPTAAPTKDPANEL